MDPADQRSGRRGRGFLARYLASKAGSGYLFKIRVAKERGYPATTFITYVYPDRPGKWDLLLAEADAILEHERCPQCGQPKYVCQNDDPDIDFQMVEETCHAMRKKAQYEERKKDDKRDGIAVQPIAYTHSDTPLELFRPSYYKQKAAEREEVESHRVVRPREHPPGWTPEAGA